MPATLAAAIAIAAAVGSPAPVPAAGWRVADHGRSRVTVVVSRSAAPMVRAAAEDLARCLGRAAGAVVPLAYPDMARHTPLAIRVGLDRRAEPGLGRDGCTLRTAGPHLAIGGGSDTGVCSGVYTLLTEIVGVRWLTPDPLFEVIPASPHLTLPHLDLRRNPDFRYRLMPGPAGDDGSAWQRRNRLDVDTRGIAGLNVGHNLQSLVPMARFGKSHPEYFAMVDGRRQAPLPGPGPNPCLSNPEVVQLAAAEAHRYFRDTPGADTFSLTIDDTADHCQCPACARLDAGLPRGQGGVRAFSGSYFQFVARVAGIVARTDPGKRIGCLAYWGVYPPPPGLARLPANVSMMLTQDSSQQFDPAYRAAERATWNAWRKRAASLGRYDYYELGWLTPRTYPHLAAADLRFLRSAGCDGFMCPIAPNWSILGPHLYVATRMLWDTRLDPDALIDDYCRAAFGGGWREMRRFYDTLERAWMRPRAARWFEGLAGMTSEFDIADGALADRAWRRLERAEAAATGKARWRVRDVRTHFRLPYLLTRMLADARALAARPAATRSDAEAIAAGIVRTLAMMTEAQAEYDHVWKPDPNYNGSTTTPASMRVRLRDWSYEVRWWLEAASRHAFAACAALPSPAGPAARAAVRGILLARQADLDTGQFVRDYHSDFDRSDRASNDGAGYSFSRNKNGELAWSESYQLMSYVEMYRATRDPAYLRRLVAHFDRVLNSRDDALGLADAFAGRPLAGWGSDLYSDKKWHVWIVHTGMITIGAADFVDVVAKQPALQAEFGAKAAAYRAKLEDCIRDAEPYWRTGPESDEGSYLDPHLKALLPLNQQNALGLVLLHLYRTTGSPAYLDRVTRLARFHHRRLRLPHSDILDWAYWPREGDLGQGSEDVSHAGINVLFAAACARERIVFTPQDIVRIARTWLQVVRRPDGTWGDTVAGEGKGNQYMPYAIGSWLCVSDLLPRHLAVRMYGDAVRAYAGERLYSAVDMLGIARIEARNPASATLPFDPGTSHSR